MADKLILLTIYISAVIATVELQLDSSSTTQRIHGKRTIAVLPPLHASLVLQSGYVAEALFQRGHEIIFIANQFQKGVLGQLFDVSHFKFLEYEWSETTLDALPLAYKHSLERLFRSNDGERELDDVFFAIRVIKNVTTNQCRDIFGSKNLLLALRLAKPDMFLIDGAGFPPCLFLTAHNISAPFVLVSTLQNPYLIGVPSLPSINPTPWWPHSDRMNFVQRVHNALIDVWIGARYVEYSPENDHLLATYAPKVKTWRELYNEALLTIIPRDHILGYPVASSPRTQYLPGMNSFKPKQLADEFLDFIGNSDFVLVSFGSVINDFPAEITDKLLQVFASFKHFKFIWKFSKGQLDLPDNIKTFSWIPQLELLAHPGVKLFIHHCGNAGQYEAAYYGVPMVGFPLFMTEQDHNCLRTERKGISRTLRIQNFTTAELTDTITWALHSPSVREKTKKLSAILKSYPPPTERAADAIEHVLTFGGEHLKGHALTMPFYKMYMLDIFLFVLSILLIFSYSLFRILRCCCSYCFNSRTKLTRKLKKN